MIGNLVNLLGTPAAHRPGAESAEKADAVGIAESGGTTETAASDFAAVLGGLLAVVAQTPAAAPVVALTFAPSPGDATEEGATLEGTIAHEASADSSHGRALGTHPSSAAELPAERAQLELVESLKRIPRHQATSDVAAEASHDLTRAASGEVSRAASKTPPRAASTAAVRANASTDTLDSAFLSRLDRVVERMAEAGHEVTITETRRTPERQRELFAQGRGTAGPVVTWTLDSRHLSGQAADVRVDGRTDGAGYALLHRLAKEEGLRTLGARDPGHLELPRSRGEIAAASATHRESPPAGQIASVAQVATVARVARVARVASTVPSIGVASGRAPIDGTESAPPLQVLPTSASIAARAATVVLPFRTAREVAPPYPLAIPVAGPAVDVASMGTSGIPDASVVVADAGARRDAPAKQADRDTQRGAGDEPRHDTRAGEFARASSTSAAQAPSGDGRVSATRFAPAGSPAGSLAAERVMELLATRDAQPARPVTELTLAFDPIKDGIESARIAMSGRQLDAALRTRDPVLARGLQAELGALTRSLEQQGLTAARVSIGLDPAHPGRAQSPEMVSAAELVIRERAEVAFARDATRDAARDTPRESPRDAQRDAQRESSRDVTRDSSRDGREQAAARDAQRDQQRARQFGLLRPRLF